MLIFKSKIMSSNKSYSATEFARCMALVFSGASMTALTIGKTVHHFSKYNTRLMAHPVLVLGSASMALSAAYGMNHFVNEIYKIN